MGKPSFYLLLIEAKVLILFSSQFLEKPRFLFAAAAAK